MNEISYMEDGEEDEESVDDEGDNVGEGGESKGHLTNKAGLMLKYEVSQLPLSNVRTKLGRGIIIKSIIHRSECYKEQ